MKGLMEVCLNWRVEGCHPDNSKWRYTQEIKEGEEIPCQQAPNSQRIKI
jgi:hypothetical protein